MMAREALTRLRVWEELIIYDPVEEVISEWKN
jgi:hypothetical protein